MPSSYMTKLNSVLPVD